MIRNGTSATALPDNRAKAMPAVPRGLRGRSLIEVRVRLPCSAGTAVPK